MFLDLIKFAFGPVADFSEIWIKDPTSTNSRLLLSSVKGDTVSTSALKFSQRYLSIIIFLINKRYRYQ